MFVYLTLKCAVLVWKYLFPSPALPRLLILSWELKYVCVTLVAAMLCSTAATRAVHAETNKFRLRQWERDNRMSHSWHLISTAHTQQFQPVRVGAHSGHKHNGELAERCTARWHTCPLCRPHSAGCQTEAAFPPGICVAFRWSPNKGVSSYKQRCVRWLWGIFTPGNKSLPQSILKPT